MVASVRSYVGMTMSLVSSDPHQENTGIGSSTRDFFSSGQSPKLTKNSTSGSMTYKIKPKLISTAVTTFIKTSKFHKQICYIKMNIRYMYWLKVLLAVKNFYSIFYVPYLRICFHKLCRNSTICIPQNSWLPLYWKSWK